MEKIIVLSNDTTYTFKLRDILLEKLVSEGYEVVVVCVKLKKVNELMSMGVRFIDIRINRHSKNPFSDLSLFNKFRRIINAEKPAVVLTYNIKSNIYGGLACKLAGVPYITTITGLGTPLEKPGIIQKISTILYRIGISKATCVMFQNESNRMYFVDRRLLGKESRTRLLPGSGVNLEKFSYEPYPEPESPIIFSVIGRIMKSKGTDDFLAAARIVKEKFPDIRFRMIGYFDDNYQSIIEKAVEEGIIEYVEEQEDVIPFIRDSWAVIQPSLYGEGMSNVLLEGAATGRPVIATDIPGCRETLDNGISGFVFPVGDSKALAETIMRFIALPYEEKVKMGKAGRIKMEKEFDRRIVAQAYLDEIRKMEGKK